MERVVTDIFRNGDGSERLDQMFIVTARAERAVPTWSRQLVRKDAGPEATPGV